MISSTIGRGVLVTGAALTATLVAVSAAQAGDGPAGTDHRHPGMERMHELHMQGHPGMERMHELHMQDRDARR